jgi:EF hand
MTYRGPRAVACAMMLGPVPYESRAWAQSTNALKALDPDNDGTVDLNEARAAASALFDRLDPDHDGTLDRRELRGRLSAKDIAAADPDKDGTLDKREYLAIVEKRYKAANLIKTAHSIQGIEVPRRARA